MQRIRIECDALTVVSYDSYQRRFYDTRGMRAWGGFHDSSGERVVPPSEAAEDMDMGRDREGKREVDIVPHFITSNCAFGT